MDDRRRETVPVALTIAGSDSGGGAGIQADLKTFEAFGVFGTSALTAVTAQDTRGVHAVHVLPPDLIREQIRAVCLDLAPAAAKTGMLASAAGVRAVVDALSEWGPERLVVDPVMVATSGDRLLEADAADVIRDALLPMATLVTPNLPEAALLTRTEIAGEADMREAARRLVDAGAGAALVKGGHGSGGEIVDLFWDGARERVFRAPRIETTSTHGTGCTLSAAAAAGLARGDALEAAVSRALAFTRAAIASAPGLGGGHGPLNHRLDPDAL